MKRLLFYWFGMLLCIACNDQMEPVSNTDDPSDLIVDINILDEDAGKVFIIAVANNSAEYHYFMGDGGQEPVVNQSGRLEYTYNQPGTYQIEVRSYGLSGRYLSKFLNVIISAGSPIDVGVGYSTPLNYPGMELVWSDEFSGNQLNTNFWSHEEGNGCPNLCGWGNNELEYYRSQNTKVENGVLSIEAREESFQGYNYTSGKIVSRNKQQVHFGRIDIRASLPEGQGIWPALWLLGVNHGSVGWPSCGEIDIMEMVGGRGRENRVTGNAFWNDNGVNDQPNGYTLNDGIFADEFHVFSLIWTPEELTWYVDDIQYHNLDIRSAEKSELRNPFYIIFNVAVGGNWPGAPDNNTVFPTRMQVDYIRAFKTL